jgi:hypothetical protein
VKTKALLTVSIAGLVLLVSAPVFAHHSFAAEFDSNKPMTIQGTVTKVDWLNPHIWIYVEAKDENGSTAKWQCEGGAPNSLVRQGWTRNSLKPGDVVTIEGFRAKDASNTMNSRTVKTAEGKRLFAGSADDGGPNAKSKE